MAPQEKNGFDDTTQQLRREIQNLKNCTEYSLWQAMKRFKWPVIHSPTIMMENGKEGEKQRTVFWRTRLGPLKYRHEEEHWWKNQSKQTK